MRWVREEGRGGVGETGRVPKREKGQQGQWRSLPVIGG